LHSAFCLHPFSTACQREPKREKEGILQRDHGMKHPSEPDTQPDEYIADLPSAHRTQPLPPNPEGTDINPVDTSSMPRGEDDDQTRRDSPEFHDRPDAPPRPDR
jgi:hypothetical protein